MNDETDTIERVGRTHKQSTSMMAYIYYSLNRQRKEEIRHQIVKLVVYYKITMRFSLNQISDRIQDQYSIFWMLRMPRMPEKDLVPYVKFWMLRMHVWKGACSLCEVAYVVVLYFSNNHCLMKAIVRCFVNSRLVTFYAGCISIMESALTAPSSLIIPYCNARWGINKHTRTVVSVVCRLLMLKMQTTRSTNITKAHISILSMDFIEVRN